MDNISKNESPATQAKLRQDFEFLDKIDITKFNGDTPMLTQNGIPLNAITKMTEEVFVRDWIVKFAVNNTSGKNYFDFEGWSKISNKHTMAVLIVDNNDQSKINYVIKPLANYEMTPRERDIMRQVHSAAHNSINETLAGQTPQVSGDDIAKVVNTMISDDRVNIHDLVPDELYKKYNVYPEALRRSFYVKDVVYDGLPPIPQNALMAIKGLFEKEERGEVLSMKEHQFIKDICGPWYQIPEGVQETVKLNYEDNNKEQPQDLDVDPDDVNVC